MLARIRLWFAKMDDWLFDARYGTDTRGMVPCRDYDVVGDNKVHGTGFQSSRPTPFRKVIRSIHAPAGSVFVDIGSGKGRMLLIASELGFKKVIGLEFVPSLCDVARRNVALLNAKGRLKAPVEIYNVDAVTYAFTGEENVFYFSNPFDAVLMRRCLDNIGASLALHPRKAWLVYMNPQEHQTVLEQGVFIPISHYKFAGTGRDFRVYVAEPRVP
jgi:SAM-dependent methyltransferase